jgi:hypothetical protein
MLGIIVRLFLPLILFFTTISVFGCGDGGSDTGFEEANQPPVSVSGVMQNVITGTAVTLDGSASRDANGDPLTYRWTLSFKPSGSNASLSSSNSVKPTFTADLAGNYVATLIVNDGKIDSASNTVTVIASSSNAAPVASPGSAQNTITGMTVTLDGSASQDANGDPLTYRWTLTSKPSGSTASLSSSNSVKPTFTADLAGNYVATLIVNDGTIDSASNTVTVIASSSNAAPVANPGNAQNVITGMTVTLDGSASHDANGDPLTYRWTLTSKPSGSTASLSSSNSVKPTFTADLAGNYVATLTVNDGKINSDSKTVSITSGSSKVKGVSYTASNGITVTLLNFTQFDLGNGYIRYTATYRQENNTTVAIDEGTMKLYFNNAEPQRQVGFFRPVLPGSGSALTRSYSWDVLSSSSPLLLQYHSDHFFANTPISDSLQWLFPIQ